MLLWNVMMPPWNATMPFRIATMPLWNALGLPENKKIGDFEKSASPHYRKITPASKN
jgi:hypothetical protein